jgi:hypothetical protein
MWDGTTIERELKRHPPGVSDPNKEESLMRKKVMR